MAKKTNTSKRFLHIQDDLYSFDVRIKAFFNQEFISKLISGNSRKVKKDMIIYFDRLGDSQVAIWDNSYNDILFCIYDDPILAEVLAKTKDSAVGAVRDVVGSEDGYYVLKMIINSKKIPAKYKAKTGYPTDELLFPVSVTAHEHNLAFVDLAIKECTPSRIPLNIIIKKTGYKSFNLSIEAINGKTTCVLFNDKNLYDYMGTQDSINAQIKNLDIKEGMYGSTIEIIISIPQ